MRAANALRSAASMALKAGPPSEASQALLAARDAPARRVLLCANSTVYGGCAGFWHRASMNAAHVVLSLSQPELS